MAAKTEAHEGLKPKKFTGQIRQEPDDWIEAIAVNEPRPTKIKFAPHKLDTMREKYGKLILIPQKKNAKFSGHSEPRKVSKKAQPRP